MKTNISVKGRAIKKENFNQVDYQLRKLLIWNTGKCLKIIFKNLINILVGKWPKPGFFFDHKNDNTLSQRFSDNAFLDN